MDISWLANAKDLNLGSEWVIKYADKREIYDRVGYYYPRGPVCGKGEKRPPYFKT